MKTKDLRPIAFHQLCAIARTVIQASPSISDHEWKERVKAVCVKQGWALDQNAILHEAVRRVESALKRTLGDRPVDLPKAARVQQVKPQQDDPPIPRGTFPKGWALIARMMAEIQADTAPETVSADEPFATQLLETTELELLAKFYTAIQHPQADRIIVLRTFAEIAIVRPDEWDASQVRAQSDAVRLRAVQCFGCLSGDRPRAWHHILQIQHGGSNDPRNRVCLCEACHGDVHPWLHLSRPRRSNPSVNNWVQVKDLVGSIDPTFPTPERHTARPVPPQRNPQEVE